MGAVLCTHKIGIFLIIFLYSCCHLLKISFLNDCNFICGFNGGIKNGGEDGLLVINGFSLKDQFAVIDFIVVQGNHHLL